MPISIIIPTFNEGGSIAALVDHLNRHAGGKVAEIIVSDGGSNDDTVMEARRSGAKVVVCKQKGRAVQMNYGASFASGDILYFVHADCFPPGGFANDILTAVNKGADLGRYRSRFDSKKLILKVNAWFTRFNLFICLGGDQTLFITSALFRSASGFRENMMIMEEYEFCDRVRKGKHYIILKGEVLISARKYETNSWLRVQLANAKVVRMYKKGASQQALKDTYSQMLNYRRNET